MYNWFECRIKYEKMLETGIKKPVSEVYLVDALSFTEAEARIIQEMSTFHADFSVSDIRRVKYADSFINLPGDRYYKVKLFYITVDEKTGAEKQTAVNMLVQSESVKQALNVIEEEMGRGMADYRVASVMEMPIIDVFPYGEAKVIEKEMQDEYNG